MGSQVSVFCVGVQKAGTTTLYDYMVSHPELAPGNVKELHYFDNEVVDWENPVYEHYHAHFPKGSDNSLRFDITPSYAFWPSALSRLHSYNSNARLIFLFRDPIERAWSHWRMEHARGNEPLTFGEAIRDGRKRLSAEGVTSEMLRTFSYVERGFYDVQVKNTLNLFPENQVLFLEMGNLSTNHCNILSRLSDFLDISPFHVRQRLRSHNGPQTYGPIPEADVHYLKSLYAETTQHLKALTDLDLSAWRTFNS